MHRAAKRRIWQTVVLVATVLALAVALPAAASIPPLETGPSLDALAAQATAEPPAPTAADAATDAPFRLFKANHNPLAGAAQGRFHLFPEAKTRVGGIDLEIAPRIELRRFQVPERTGFTLFGGEESRRRARILYYAKARYYDPELALWLTEDPFAGEVNNPPSLHRYLYAYQNPTVWVDPTGEINVIRDAQEDVRRKRDEIADEVDSDEEVSGAAVKLAALNLLDKGLGLLNAGANVVISTAAPDSELGQEARAEIDEVVEDTAEAARETVEQVVEDPTGFATTISMTPQELMKDGLKTSVLAVGAKDPKTRAENQAAVLEVGAEVLAGVGVVSRGKKALDVIDEVTDARPRRAPSARSLEGSEGGNAPEGAARAESALQAERLRARLSAQELATAPRVGSGLKSDPFHRAGSFVVDDVAEGGRVFALRGGDGVQRTLTQVEGTVNGQRGVFEWVADPTGSVTHQRFIPGGRITGSPNQVP